MKHIIVFTISLISSGILYLFCIYILGIQGILTYLLNSIATGMIALTAMNRITPEINQYEDNESVRLIAIGYALMGLFVCFMGDIIRIAL